MWADVALTSVSIIGMVFLESTFGSGVSWRITWLSRMRIRMLLYLNDLRLWSRVRI